MSLEKLIQKVKNNFTKDEVSLIKKAYSFASDKHEGQKRLSGDDYITHPLEVAIYIANLGLDATSIIAALLHDVVEDTDTKLNEIEAEFGTKVAELVDGVTKLGEIDFSKIPESAEELRLKSEIENLRKFFLAMAKDIRVVIIKLEDRLHNMRTLYALKEADQKRIARETLEVFAPLADRLGMGALKAELEDLAFKYFLPDEYRNISELVELTKKERKYYLSKIKKVILTELEKEGIKATVDGRVKHLYSIYNKLQKVNNDISKIYDLLAIRIIVDTVEDCYKALGIIHKGFKPLIYRIKDYIAVPKPNGYQSLHTTVFGINGRITEIQIRTAEMHDEAEKGVAAHWYYSETKQEAAYKGKTKDVPVDRMNWVNKVMDWQKSVENPRELSESLKIDLFNDRIFAFTPKGEVIDLPENATPVDFAYEIHTQIGHRCRGAKVNGKIATLDYKLQNRDVVDIILAPKNDKSGPSRGWLEFVMTSKAKQNIRSFFKRLNFEVNVEEGRKLLVSELAMLGMTEADIPQDQIRDLVTETHWKSWDDILASIGDGTVTARQMIKKIIGQKIFLKIDKPERVGKIIDEDEGYSNLSGVLVRYAACCRPKKGDEIKGYITQGQGITIHLAECPNLLASDREKIVNIDFEIPKQTGIKVEITGTNRIGFIRDVTQVISNENISIDEIKTDVLENDIVKIIVRLITESIKLADLLYKLKRIEGVTEVKKI